MEKKNKQSMRRALLALVLFLLPLTYAIARGAAESQAANVQPGQVILLRHGQSFMNVESRVSGWGDTHLTDAGRAAGIAVGELMRREGISFDAVYTSYLARAIKTSWAVLEAMDMMYVPVYKGWRLNETEHGAFEGRTREENVAAFGEEIVSQWLASYNVRPPRLASGTPSPRDHRRYDRFRNEIPEAESILDTYNRVKAHWDDVLAPAVRSGQTIMVVGHTNVLRVLSKIIDETIEFSELTQLNIPNTVPIIYTFDANLKFVERRIIN
jgi:2,3-bisphosphoglycerate-dependent phosphoglycerate mutase